MTRCSMIGLLPALKRMTSGENIHKPVVIHILMRSSPTQEPTSLNSTSFTLTGLTVESLYYLPVNPDILNLDISSDREKVDIYCSMVSPNQNDGM